MIKIDDRDAEFKGSVVDILADVTAIELTYVKYLEEEGFSAEEIDEILDEIKDIAKLGDCKEGGDALARVYKKHFVKPNITVITCTPDNLDEAVGVITDAIMENMERTVGEKEDGSSD